MYAFLSRKVIENSTIRQLVQEFHIYSGPILYHFRDKAIYWSKIASFNKPTPVAFDAPVWGPRRILPYDLVENKRSK